MMRLRKYSKIIGASITILSCLVYLIYSIAHAFPVPPLPNDNLIVNPWFRSASDPTFPGLDGWTNVLQNGIGWGLSQKDQNPSPDIVISGRCGFKPIYCGTAARWSKRLIDGVEYIYPGLDVYLYQVVLANSANRKLRFFTYWVTHKVEILEVTIYGGSSPAGPWTNLWVPLSHTQDVNPPPPPGGKDTLWANTSFLEKTISVGYSYYKVEIHARYPQPLSDSDAVGAKITGIYFVTEPINGISTLTPTPTLNTQRTKTPMATKEPTPDATPSPAFQIYLPTIVKIDIHP